LVYNQPSFSSNMKKKKLPVGTLEHGPIEEGFGAR
jgi:hypothetical protein